jgi:secreted trypsin-like serine protease
VGETASVAGAGSDQSGDTTTAKRGEERVISQEECNAASDPDLVAVGDETMFCAATGTSAGPRVGDDGGPLTSGVDGQRVLIGILGPVYADHGAEFPDVYTNVVALSDWIRANM